MCVCVCVFGAGGGAEAGWEGKERCVFCLWEAMGHVMDGNLKKRKEKIYIRIFPF